MPASITTMKAKTQSTEKDNNQCKNSSQLLEMNEEIEEEITSEDLAPDGGFGWIIAISMVLVFVSAIKKKKKILKFLRPVINNNKIT